MNEPVAPGLIEEGRRMAAICNACRYCEGYCATFPALERRLSFEPADLAYLANLCHGCGACYYSCPYAPPHEFQLNLPRLLAQIRAATYRKYAWPGLLASLFERNERLVSIATALSLAGFLLALSAFTDPSVLFAAHPDAEGAFYAVLSHEAMTFTFGAVSLFVVAALVIGFLRFWRDIGEPVGELLNPAALGHALHDALRLRYLEGGGGGCTYPDERFSQARRHCHHATFYGFLLCFAATSVASLYHYGFGWKAPYPFWSLPVLLGTVGGVGLIVGPIGLLWLKGRRDREVSDERQIGMDVGFLLLLLFTSITGLLLLGLRETAAMGVVLAVHLGFVMALFVTLPYGKFVHAVYRLAALGRFHIEKKRPLPDLRAD